MGREFRLPDLGSGLQEGQIVRWCVAVGDAVQSEATLCEIETEKSVIEIPVPYDGVISRLACDAGERVKVGDVLAVFESGDAAVEPMPSADVQAPPAEPVAGPVAASTVTAQQADTGSNRRRAMPAARRLAASQGVDLAAVEGTGKGGRVTKQDVMRHAAAGTAVEPPPAAEGRFERFSMIRQTIAENMARSWREIPHVFSRIEVDARRLLEARKVLGEELGHKVPLEALLTFAVLPALKAHPVFNAVVRDGGIEYYGRYDIGAAVDTPDGLVVPVLRNADRLSLPEMVAALADLQERAARRRLPPDLLKGATFTVNNIGALGRIMGTSIIPLGTTAILSVGRATPRVTLVDGRLENVATMEVSLAFDHRAIDGGMASRFLETVARRLEHPVAGLLG